MRGTDLNRPAGTGMLLRLQAVNDLPKVSRLSETKRLDQW